MTTARPRMGTGVTALALVSLLGLAALAQGCDKVQQQLTGAKDQRPALLSLRATLAGERARLSGAVQGGNMDFVPGYFNEVKSTLDSLDTQAGKMSMMDSQEMRLKVASAREVIKSAEPFVMQNDVEGVKAQQRNLDQVLFDIDEILDRAVKMTDEAPTGGGS
jgi:hypothetical protein